MLALTAGLDQETAPEAHEPAIRTALEANPDVTIERTMNLNHNLQPAMGGDIGEYGLIETTVDERLLNRVTNWIRDRARPPNSPNPPTPPDPDAV